MRVEVCCARTIKSAPQPKPAANYFISTRNLRRIDDLLEIGIGAVAFKHQPVPALWGAMAGTVLIDAPVSRYNNEEEIRIRRFKSICFSLLMGAVMYMEHQNPIISGLAGIFAVNALARQVIGKPVVYS
jgi:hypothetical protein